MFEALGIVLLAAVVVVGSVFLLGLGTLLRRRCDLGRCGEAAEEACSGCPNAARGASDPAPGFEA